MARTELNTGTAPTGAGGDTSPEAAAKINAMTLELYARVGSPITVAVTASRAIADGDQNRALYVDTSSGDIVLSLPDDLDDDVWILVINEGAGAVSFVTLGAAAALPASVTLDNSAPDSVGLSNLTLHHKSAGAWRIYAGVAQAYDVQLGYLGEPTASQTDKVLASRAFLINSADPGEVDVGTNPSASWVLDVQLNGVSVGDVTISTSGVATWDIATAVELARGDVLSIEAPASADATVADVLVAFRGLLL